MTWLFLFSYRPWETSLRPDFSIVYTNCSPWKRFSSWFPQSILLQLKYPVIKGVGSSHIFSEEAFLRVLSHEVPCMPSCPQNKPSWNPSWESRDICVIFNSCLNLPLKYKNVKDNHLREKALTILAPKEPGEDQCAKSAWLHAGSCSTALCALLPGESCLLPLCQGSLIEGVPEPLVPLQLLQAQLGEAAQQRRAEHKAAKPHPRCHGKTSPLFPAST